MRREENTRRIVSYVCEEGYGCCRFATDAHLLSLPQIHAVYDGFPDKEGRCVGREGVKEGSVRGGILLVYVRLRVIEQYNI